MILFTRTRLFEQESYKLSKALQNIWYFYTRLYSYPDFFSILFYIIIYLLLTSCFSFSVFLYIINVQYLHLNESV